ncbi:MAG: hypothetical protein ACXVCP_16445 [Bdellovibrio sp.]
MRNLVCWLFIFAILIQGAFVPVTVFADDKVSKANAYTVIGPVSGNVSVSKANAYTVIAPLNGKISVSKMNAYTVIAPLSSKITVSKAIAYVVVGPPSVQKQPSVFIMTKIDEAYPLPATLPLAAVTDILNYDKRY